LLNANRHALHLGLTGSGWRLPTDFSDRPRPNLEQLCTDFSFFDSCLLVTASKLDRHFRRRTSTFTSSHLVWFDSCWRLESATVGIRPSRHSGRLPWLWSPTSYVGAPRCTCSPI